ncbi:Transcription factor GTE8 [Linum grandiflorum]
MAKSDTYRGAYYRSSLSAAGEFEGSASSGQIDMENYSAPARKFVNLNSSKRETFGVPTQVFASAKMSSSERKDLALKLRSELEQIRIFQKKVVDRGAGVAHSSNHILNGTSKPYGAPMGSHKKSSALTSGSGYKGSAVRKLKPHSVREPAASNMGNALLMKQCRSVLDRLMGHQFGYIFNSPVDVEKLNIPDYFTIIKRPMDLGTIKRNITQGVYSSPLEFAEDVRLTFRNAMLYNPKGNDVHMLALSLSKEFETRWKLIEKKLPKNVPNYQPEKPRYQPEKPIYQPEKPVRHEHFDAAQAPSTKKRKISSSKHEGTVEPVKRVMTSDEKYKLSAELEALLPEMPMHIIDFLKEHSSGQDAGQDEIEIDIDDLSDDTLFTLRKLLDDHAKKKQENLARGEPCEIELLNESAPINSPMQPHRDDDPLDEDVDIGGDEPPGISYPPVEIECDLGPESHKFTSSDSGGSEIEFDHVKPSSQLPASKVPEEFGVGGEQDDKTIGDHFTDKNQSVSGLDQLEENSRSRPGSDESDSRQDGESAPSERQGSPHKNDRSAMIRKRFSSIIWKAKEEKLQVDKVDPDELRQEREKLELEKKKEIARLEAEVKAAEEARKQAEAAAAEEARRQREIEREAARQALLEIERTVEINEHSKLLDKMLRTAPPVEQLPSSVEELIPDQLQDDELGGFEYGGESKTLERLGLFMKHDDDEEEEGCERMNCVVEHETSDVEEGEIDID